MLRHILALCLLLLPLSVRAQEKPLITKDDLMSKEYHLLYGQVLDNVTRRPLIGVKTQLFAKDSTLVFEWTIVDNVNVCNLQPVFALPLPEAGEYTLCLSKDNYEPVTLPYKIEKLRRSEMAILHAPLAR